MPGWMFSGYRRPERLERPAAEATPKPAAEPLPTLTWNGAAHMGGTCPHLAIYTTCSCDVRKPTAL